MARNKDFFVNSTPKRDKSFFVGETAPASAVSAPISAVNKSEKPIFDTTKVQNRIAELDNLMKETDLKIRQQAKYTPEQRNEFQKQYGIYKDEYWKLKNELTAQTPKQTVSELPKSKYYSEGAQLLTQEQIEELNKKAPLTQKIDKAIKYDIPKTAEKVARTAGDLALSGLSGATNAIEGITDFAVGNVGAFASGVTSGFGLAPNSLSEKIKKGAEDFTRFNFSAEEILEEKKKEGTGIYEPKILGFKVRDAINTISNMFTSAAIAGVPGFITSAAGQGIEEALLDNQSLNRAVVYGDVSGAIEGLTEKMFDAVKLLGGGKFDKFLPKGAIGKLIGGSVGEGVEEVIADGINPFLKYLTYEKGTYDMPTLAEYLNTLKESAWNGFVIGLIMKGGQDISSPQIREQYKQEVYTAVDKSKLPDDVKGIVKEAMITPAQAQINQDIKNYKNIFNDSENIMQNNLQNTNNVKNVLRELPQIAELQQPNVTLPTQTEMAQKANMGQINKNTTNDYRLQLPSTVSDVSNDSINSNNHDANGNFNEFGKQVDDLIAGRRNRKDSLVVLPNTPKIIQELGAKDLPITVTSSKLERIMNAEGKQSKQYHDLGVDIVKQLPEALEKPLNILKSHDNSFVVVTELADKQDRPIIASIKIDGTGKLDNLEILSNVMTSAYGRNNYDSYMQRNIKEGNLVYDIDEGIIKENLNDGARLQLSRTTNKASNNIIPNNDTNINTQYAQNEGNMPPTQSEQRSKLRNFYQTAQEGSIVDEQYVKDIQKNKSQFEYEPISNQETLTNARNVVNEDKVKAERDFLAFNGDGVSADDVAIAEVLIAEAIKDGDTSRANYLTATLAEKLTQAGQAIQATKIFKRMTPEGMILYAQKEINKANKKIESENPKLYKKLKEEGALPKLDDSDIQKITQYMQEAQSIPDDYWNSRKKEVAIAKAMSVAGNKIPSSTIEKIASIRRSGLLTNIKTLLRNIGSNASFGSLEMLKDIPATGIDKLTSLVTKERTTTLPNLKAYGKGFAKGAVEGVQDVKEDISTAGRGSKYELPSKTFKRQDTYKDIAEAFKNKDAKEGTKKAFRRALSDYEDVSMYIVEGTDRPFWQGRFESELANQMKLKGLEYGVDTPTNDMLEVAKTSADYATFKNKNKLSETFGKIKQALNGGQPLGLADVLGFTFTNVPGSVGSKVYNYSPAGIMTSAKELYNGIKQNGKFDQRKFVDSLSRALVGSGGWALGSYLIGQGIIRGAADDDDDKANAERQMGLQENSLNISALERLINGEDTSLQKGDKFYSFDWLQPVSAPILIGADVNNAVEQGENGVFAGAKSAVNQIADMSSLSQVSKLFKGYSGADLAENLLKVAGEFPSSFIPTIWNNAGQFTDEYKRVSYDSTDAYFKTNVNKILAKIPGLRNTLEKQIDTFGNEQKQYRNGNDFWSTFINPGYNSTYDPTPLQEEILRVYQETGDKGVFPITAGGSITFKSETAKLNPKQKMTYQKTSGEYVTQILSKVIETDAYKSLDDTQKATLLKEVISDSNTLGKASVGLKNKTYDDYMKKVNQLGNVPLESYYSAYVAQKGIESDKDNLGRTIENSKSKKVKKAIDNATMGLSKNQRKVLYNIFNVSKAVQ